MSSANAEAIAVASVPASVAADAVVTDEARSVAESLRELRRGLRTTIDVVGALILRETRTRFGDHQLGYLWALLEPSIIIFTLFWFYGASGRSHPEGMDLFSYLATGVLPFQLFSNSLARVAESINANKPLLYYPQVRPIDLIVARAILEAATYSAVFILLMAGHAIAVKDLTIDNPLMLIAGFLGASLLGSTMGLVFCGLGEISNVAERARGPIMKPLFWISGIFFTANSLSPHARAGMLLNPLLHVTEMVRDGWFTTYDDEYVSFTYVLSWIGVLAVAGLLLERYVRRRIEMS